MNCLQIVHSEVEVEVVHVADVDVDFVHELRARPSPNAAADSPGQIIPVIAHVAGHVRWSMCPVRLSQIGSG